MFQLIVSGTYFNVNDQNISPLLLSLYPSLTLSLSIFLSPSPTLLTSLSPSIPLSLSPSLLLSLSFSPTPPLYFSTFLPSPSLEPERALYYQVSCHYHVSYLGNQGYPGSQLLQFLFQLLSGWTLKSSNPESSRSQSDHGHLI